MSSWSPTLEGFGAIFRRPGISIAEIIWRWSFGAAACFLLGAGFVQYLGTLPVSNADRLLLRTRHPALVTQALSHILEGSALRFVLATIVLFSALAVLWVAMSAIGRRATLHPLLDYIRERARVLSGEAAEHNKVSSAPDGYYVFSRLRSILGLNSLRASLALAAGASMLAVFIVARVVSSKSHPHPGVAFFLSLLLMMLIWMLWSSISWVLSVASIFVVRQDADTFGALNSAVEMCRQRFGPVMAVGTWFGLMHLVLFFVATSVVSFPMGLAPVLPPGLMLTAVLILTLGYFALTDALHIGRLAAYIAILEAPPQREVAMPQVPLSGAGSQGSAADIQGTSTRVDQDELILSDIVESTQHSAVSIQPIPDLSGGNAPNLASNPKPTS